MEIALMREVQLSGEVKQVEDMKLQAVTKRERFDVNLCQWCFRIHLSYSSVFHILNIKVIWKLH